MKDLNDLTFYLGQVLWEVSAPTVPSALMLMFKDTVAMVTWPKPIRHCQGCSWDWNSSSRQVFLRTAS
jgi:hypothetical protein|eukprot:COSAG06_NODE_278_length_18546_cov_7.134981_4_plen_68_part_00